MRTKFLVSAAVIALVAVPAYGQDDPAAKARAAADATPGSPQSSSDDQSNDIVITAQKFEQKLQDVPAAVTAYDSKARDRIGILNNQDLAAFTPSLSISDDPPRVFIRGVGQNSGQRSSDPGVGLYFDGFYANNAAAISSPPLINDRIEVLRGPQGTLYGKNTTGGAINIISKHPTDTFTGEFRANVSNYEHVQTGLTLSGPLTSWLRYRVTGTYDWQGRGYIHNTAGTDFGTGRKYGFQAQIEADLASNLKLWLKYDFARTDNVGAIATYRGTFDTTTESLDGLNINPTLGYTGVNPGIADARRQERDVENTFRGSNHQIVGHLDWSLSDAVTLRYVGGYNKAHAAVVVDLDQSARTEPFKYTGSLSVICGLVGYSCMYSPVTRGDITGDPTTYSNEINLLVNTKKFDAIVGVYQYYENAPYTSDLRHPLQPELAPAYFNNNPRGTYIDVSGGNKNLTYAGFAQVDYKLTDTLTFKIGGRYTYDKKEVSSQVQAINFFVPSSLFICGSLFCGYPPGALSSLTREFEGWSGDVGLQWQPNHDTNIYAFVSRGYKAGAITDVTHNVVIPAETVTDYEAGVKHQFGKTLSLNLAAFYYNYDNIQIQTTGKDPVVPGNYLQIYVSAPRARTLGFEAEANWQIAPGLNALLVYSYLDAKILELNGVVDLANPGAGAQNVSGNAIPQSPKNKIALNLGYTFDIGDKGSLTMSGNYSYTSKKYFDIYSNNPIYRGKAFDQVDLRLMFNDAKKRFTVIAYASNLFNVTATNYIALINGTNQATLDLNQPRTIGAELQVHF